MTEKSHPVDRIVGRNVRIMRGLRGLSQTALGDRVGVTFQQIQKYEKGSNRISASRLFEIAKVLDTDVKWFFEDSPLPASDDSDFAVPITEILGTKLDLMIMQKLFEIEDIPVKRRLLALIDALADSRDAAPADTRDEAAMGDAAH